MNQAEAADLLDVSVATVSRICSGERRPSLDLMYVIEERMNWPLQDQANEIRCDAYYSAFKKRMEAIGAGTGA